MRYTKLSPRYSCRCWPKLTWTEADKHTYGASCAHCGTLSLHREDEIEDTLAHEVLHLWSYRALQRWEEWVFLRGVLDNTYLIEDHLTGRKRRRKYPGYPVADLP